MPKCDLCGEDAGFLRNRHKECQQRYDEGVRQIDALAYDAALSESALAQLRPTAEQIAKSAFINGAQLRGLFISGWERAVGSALEDDLLSQYEERALVAYLDHFSFSQDDLDKNSAYTNLAKAGVLRDLLEGKLPSRVTVTGSIPFNFQKKENLLWFYNNVQYHEERSRTTYTGGYQGASFRVAKGVYYRVGGFRGNPVVTSQMVHVATGQLGITEKHIYFSGGNKAFRVAYAKIVAFRPFSDGFGIQRDAATARPQVFITGDGWFIYNLVTNLADMAAA